LATEKEKYHEGTISRPRRKTELIPGGGGVGDKTFDVGLFDVFDLVIYRR
jgi:hypothetical protein